MYHVMARSAEKDLRRLAPDIRARAVSALSALAKNPPLAGSRKPAGTAYDWRIRVGEYRIVYETADQIRIVRINRVRHRSDVYR